MNEPRSEFPSARFLETKSPSLIYNVAVCEAFQRSAAKAKLPNGHQDTEREVVFLGGSFGKGIGTSRFSDLDVMDITTGEKRTSKWVGLFFENMESEFDTLVSSDPRFASVEKYSAISNVIRDRQQVRIKRIREELGDSSNQAVSNRIEEIEARSRALAERAVGSVHPTDLQKPALPHRVDFEIESTTLDSVVSRLENPATAENLEAMLVLSSLPGINAYEVTPGNLQFQQGRIVATLSQLHDTNPETYTAIYQMLENSWSKYKYRVKSLEYIQEIEKTRNGLIFPFGDFFKFDKFPSVDVLRSFFKYNESNVKLS